MSKDDNRKFVREIDDFEDTLQMFFKEDDCINRFKYVINCIKGVNPNVIIRGTWDQIIGISQPGYRFIMYVVPSHNGFLVKFQGCEVLVFKNVSKERLTTISVNIAEKMMNNRIYKVNETSTVNHETKDERVVRLLLSIETLRSGVDPETGEILEKNSIINSETLRLLLCEAEKQLRKEQRDLDKKSGLNYGKWSNQDEEALRILINSGKTSREIAKELNRSPLDEYYKLKTMGVIEGPHIAKNDNDDKDSSEPTNEELLELINKPIKNSKPTCDKCKKLINESCGGMGNPLTCVDFDPIPTVTEEEKAMWPKYGIASFYRLKNQDDGHHELR